MTMREIRKKICKKITARYGADALDGWKKYGDSRFSCLWTLNFEFNLKNEVIAELLEEWVKEKISLD